MERSGINHSSFPFTEKFWAISLYKNKESQAFGQQIYNKRNELYLKEISKQEAHILNKNYGVPFGSYGISHSFTRYKKYYLCESPKNMNALNKIRGIYNDKRTKYERKTTKLR